MTKKGCVDKNAENKAVLTPQEKKYRKNGYSHIGGEPGRRGVYDNVMQIKEGLRSKKSKPRKGAKGQTIEPFSDAHAARYKFEVFSPDKAGKPYPNEAHHLIPMEFFGPKYLSSVEKAEILVRQIAYNINNGENIIFLPNSVANACIHSLPVHYRSHPKYNKAVIEANNQIRQEILNAIDKDQKHTSWDPPEGLVKQLKDLEKALWNLVVGLVKGGKIKVNMVTTPMVDPTAAQA